ncbi:hypothetical protein [Tardiphaga sp. 285_C5_N1_2]|uniref:hypothetical protein n=1 Tax=Tardiphaga sp. 285_C5_N1_2 TaxID=3240775 RepID=UPI003F88D1B9
MPKQYRYEGQLHTFPDHFTEPQILRALSEYVPTAPLPDLTPADRKFPFAGQALPPVVAPRVGMFDDRVPSKPGMFDDLIPPPPPGLVVDRPATPPLPPGFKLDKPVTDPALIAQLEGRPQAANAGPAGLPPGFEIQDTPAAPGPRLIPVDHDPFAQFADAPPAPKGPTYTPVDHDPFAQFADAPPASGRPRVYIDGKPPAAPPSTGPTALHSLAVGAQGVASGIKDTVLAPVDLMAGLQNMITAGFNKVAGTQIPMATPASKMVEQIAEPFTIPEKNMSRGEKLGYDINRFGTQGLGMGAMLAARAPQVAASVTSSPTLGGRVMDTLARPYKNAPARTVVGDTIGGAGAGVAVNAADAIPEHPAGGDWIKHTANVAAPLAGGIGANAAQGIVEGLGGMLKNAAKRAFTSAPTEIPLSPNKTPYSHAELDRAATNMQAGATGSPKAIAQDIRENAGELTNPKLAGESPVDASALPTSALLSRDPGLVTMEAGSRSKSAPEFIQRDQNVKEAAATRVDSMRDPEADLGAVFRRAEQNRNERMNAADATVKQRSDEVTNLNLGAQDQGAEFGAIANTDYKANASRRIDKTIVNDGYVPARAEKNRQFDTAPGRSEQLPADDVFAAIDRLRAGTNPLAPMEQQLPGELVNRLERLRPRMVDGENVGGTGTASGADLADVRKYLSFAQNKAQKDGNFDLASNVGQLRAAINRTLNDAPGYAEANANYRSFADRYRPAPGDEAAKFTKELDRSGNIDGYPNRGSTPPSETAKRFLSGPETSAVLQRLLDGAPNAAIGHTAVRDYLRSDFAMKVLNPDGTLNPAKSASWANHNASVLAAFPNVQREFNSITLAAKRGQQLSADARASLEQARTNLKATEADIDRSAVGTLIREDPRDVASKLLTGGYGSEKRLDEIVALVKHDAPARRGWKAAVAEVLTDKVQGSRVVGEAPEVQLSRLSKEFKDNEALLAKTFSPEEMNGLRQAHKLLGYFKEAEKRGTSGSNTADKWNVPGWAQLAVRHFKGDLAGGGLIKRFKLLLEQLPTNRQSADEIVQMAWFNPDVAAYLLERPIKNANVPAYNINLRRLIAADNGARENAE